MIVSEHQNRRSVTRLGTRAGRLFIALLIGSLACPAHAQTETRRVLAIRVSFPQETPDEETTSGDGTFDLRSFDEAQAEYRFPFDTPPHDREYFVAHLQALAHYFSTVSDGRLVVEHDVLPAGRDDSYVLERRLIDYGNGRTRTEINTRIVELFRDGVLAADLAEGGALDFSAYDDIIVIHAGLGGESSNQLNDVPSAFVDLDDLNTYADGAIMVDDGASTVTRGILLPEAGGSDGRGGLNGIFARFYAHALGLPRLDNPEDGLPAIGDWSLLDTGNIAFGSSARLGMSNLTGDPSDTLLVGYTPSLLTAWSRIRMGWLTPAVVRHDTTVTVAAPYSDGPHAKAVRIPVTADEYFLIENRISRLDVEGRRPNITFSDGNRGVWVANDDYDAFIPGSGILIWHVDDAVIRASTGGKAVNANEDFRVHFDGLVGLYRKGIALEEADGLEDIGNTSANRVITSGIISFADISGGPNDPYYVGNVTRFGTDTTPASRSNLGYETGIEIEVLSAPGETMDVAIRFNRHANRWPRETTGSAGAPRSAVVLGDRLVLAGETAWTAAGDETEMAGYASALTPAVGRLGGRTDDILLVRDGAAVLWSDERVRTAADAGFLPAAVVSAPPMIAAFPAAGANDVWGYTDGRVVWGTFGPASGQADLGSDPVTSLAAGNVAGSGTAVVALTEGGDLHVVTAGGAATRVGTVDDPVGGPAVADLDRDGIDDIAVLSADGSLSIFSVGETTVSRPAAGGAASPPVLADIDGDGFVEVLFGGDSRVWVVRFNGIIQADTPVEIPIRDRAGSIAAPPLVADLDADGALDIVAAARTGTVYAVSASGTPVPGFPILATGGITTSPLLDDLDGDGILELVAFTDAGSAHLWHLDRIDPALVGTAVAWGQAGGGPGGTSRLSQSAVPVDPPASTDLLPEARAYVYPNPVRGAEAYVRYHLGADADVSLIVVNATGRVVDRIDAARATAGTDNEIVWDTTGYGSGLYVCRLQATDGTRTETRFIKAAVIR